MFLVGDRHSEFDLKKRIVKCTELSIAVYGAKTWTMTQAGRERLEAFDNVNMEENVNGQLGRQSIKCRIVQENSSKMKTQIGGQLETWITVNVT